MIKTSRIALAVLLSGAAIATGVGCGSSSDSASSESASSGGAEYSAEVRDAFISTCSDKAVSEAQPMLEAEGLPQFQERHRRMAKACRAAARVAGLELFAGPACASDIVTAITSPDGLDSGALVRALREQHNIIISGGQDALKGKIFRIGHLGAVQFGDLLRTWEAVGKELGELGHGCDVEAVLTELEDVYHGL